MPREKSAGAIIYRMEPDGRGNSAPQYLLLHYGPGHWGFAKGHVEGNETEEETTRREVAEETGITDLRILSGFKEIEKYFFRQYPRESGATVPSFAPLRRSSSEASKASSDKAKRPWVFKLVTFFVAETKTTEIKISHEHTGFVWLPYEAALKKTTFKNSKILLKKANEFINKQ